MVALDDDLKVMDISKPGKGRVVATSRPVVAPIVDSSKPTIDGGATAEESQKTGTGSARKVIQPISGGLKSDESAEEVPKEQADSPDDSQPTEANKPEEKTDQDNSPAMEMSDAASVEALASTAETKKQAAKKAEEQAKREAELNELIASKKYFVPVKHGVGGSSGARLALFLLIGILALLAGAYLLVDAGVIDLGIELPYEIIKN